MLTLVAFALASVQEMVADIRSTDMMGCFDVSAHACKCDITSRTQCILQGPLSHRWIQGCSSCYEGAPPDSCGFGGTGVNCGCYFLRSPDAVAGNHGCACHIKHKDECADVAGPIQGIWVSAPWI